MTANLLSTPDGNTAYQSEEATPQTAEEWVRWIKERTAETDAAYLAKPDWLKGHFNAEASTSRDYAGRELLELVQNAADAAAEHGGHGRVRIEVDAAGLCVANTGMPFRAGGVRSLMTAHTSDKPDRQATLIGAKGLGFRALLNWSAEPFISSGTLEIGFSRASAHEHLRALAKRSPAVDALVSASRKPPAPVLAFPMVGASLYTAEDGRQAALIARARKFRDDGYDTVVAAAFEGDKALAQAKAQLAEFQPDFLLFVSALDEIVLKIGDEPEIRWTKREPAPNCFEIEIEQGERIERQCWVCLRQRGEVLDPEDAGQSKRPYELAVAVRQGIQTKAGTLHCYFPTEVALPFPALFHATLELDSNRKALNARSDLNEEVLAALAEFYADCLVELRALDPSAVAISLLTRAASFPEPLKAFERWVYEAARTRPLVPTNGGHSVVADRAQLGPAGYNSYLPKRLFRSLARCRHDTDRSTLERLKVGSLEPAAMIDALKEAALTIDERARAIGGIAKTLPKKFHDRALLLDSSGRRLTHNNSCFPPPASGRPPALPRWARAKFLDPELWRKIVATMPGAPRERFGQLDGFGIHEFNAQGVITSLRQQAAQTLRRGRADPDKLRRELLGALFGLRQTVASEASYPAGRTEVFCADGEWRIAAEVHLSAPYGGHGAIVSALYRSQPERLLGTPEMNGLEEQPSRLADFFRWIGVNIWPVQLERTVPSAMREIVLDALPSRFEVSEGNQRRSIDRDELYWGSTWLADHLWVAGLEGILSTAPSAAILAWLALDPRFDIAAQSPFWTRVRAKSGHATYKPYHGPLPDLVREALRTRPWLETDGGDRAAPRDAMISPGRLGALFVIPARPSREDERVFGLSKTLWARGLLHAHVPQRISDLREGEVYRLLLNLKGRKPSSDVVRRLYAQILEIEGFDPARAGEEAAAFWVEGEVQVRKSGVVTWEPVASALYLDRDNFPAAAREHLAIIDLPPRRNATEVKARFGVRPLGKEDFSLTITGLREEQGVVSAILRNQFADALPFIKAFRAATSTDAHRLRRMDTLLLKVVVDADLAFSLGNSLFEGKLEPGKHLLDGDALIVAVDLAESEEEIILRATTAMSDGLAALFELQSGDNFEKLLLPRSNALRMLQLKRLLDNHTTEEIDQLIAKLDAEIAGAEDDLLGIDAETFARATEPEGNGQSSASPDEVPASSGSSVADQAASATATPASPSPTMPPSSPPVPPPKAEAVVATRLEIAKQGSGGGWSIGTRIAGSNSSTPAGRSDIEAPSDAEAWAILFEEGEGRHPIRVSRLQGSDAYGCDCLSFDTVADRTAFRKDPSRVSLVGRFIEVKSGAVRLTVNEVKAAERHKDRYFIYQILFDAGTRASAHLTIVANPLRHQTALARECEVHLDQITERERIRLDAVAKVKAGAA